MVQIWLFCLKFVMAYYMNKYKARKLKVKIAQMTLKFKISGCTVQCCYNAVNFPTNIHKRHPIARPSGRAMECFVEPASDWYSAAVPLIIYAISYNFSQICKELSFDQAWIIWKYWMTLKMLKLKVRHFEYQLKDIKMNVWYNLTHCGQVTPYGNIELVQY